MRMHLPTDWPRADSSPGPFDAAAGRRLTCAPGRQV